MRGASAAHHPGDVLVAKQCRPTAMEPFVHLHDRSSARVCAHLHRVRDIENLWRPPGSTWRRRRQRHLGKPASSHVLHGDGELDRIERAQRRGGVPQRTLSPRRAVGQTAELPRGPPIGPLISRRVQRPFPAAASSRAHHRLRRIRPGQSPPAGGAEDAASRPIDSRSGPRVVHVIDTDAVRRAVGPARSPRPALPPSPTSRIAASTPCSRTEDATRKCGSK